MTMRTIQQVHLDNVRLKKKSTELNNANLALTRELDSVKRERDHYEAIVEQLLYKKMEILLGNRQKMKQACV